MSALRDRALCGPLSTTNMPSAQNAPTASLPVALAQELAGLRRNRASPVSIHPAFAHAARSGRAVARVSASQPATKMICVNIARSAKPNRMKSEGVTILATCLANSHANAAMPAPPNDSATVRVFRPVANSGVHAIAATNVAGINVARIASRHVGNLDITAPSPASDAAMASNI